MKHYSTRVIEARNVFGFLLPPLITGATAAGVTAWMVSVGQWGVAIGALWLGLLGSVPMGFLALTGREVKLAVRWPHLWFSGWRPSKDRALDEVLEDVYDSANAALVVLHQSGRQLGLDFTDARDTVTALVGRARAVAEHRQGLHSLLEHQQSRARFHAMVTRRARLGQKGAPRLATALASARADRQRLADAERAVEACDDDLAAVTSTLLSLRGRVEACRLELLADPQRRGVAVAEALAHLHQRASALDAASQTLTRTREVLQ